MKNLTWYYVVDYIRFQTYPTHAIKIIIGHIWNRPYTSFVLEMLHLKQYRRINNLGTITNKVPYYKKNVSKPDFKGASSILEPYGSL